ncbi:hypothetical protein FA041_09470 [Escherichia coli]|nr:hypothetical protein [Escherichia coli]
MINHEQPPVCHAMPTRCQPIPFIDFSSYQMHRKIAFIDGQTHHQTGSDDCHFLMRAACSADNCNVRSGSVVSVVEKRKTSLLSVNRQYGLCDPRKLYNVVDS